MPTSLPTIPPATTPPAAAPPDLDRLVHAQLARLMLGLSPASMAAAWLDWLGHVALSPGKQQELPLRARCGMADSAAARPDPPHRRFTAPAWQQWPFNGFARKVLQHQRCWQEATTGVHGVSARRRTGPLCPCHLRSER